MTKKQVAILAGLGMAVLIVFCVLGYLVVDKVAITSGGVSISLAITPKPTSTLRPTPRPQPTWPPTWTPTPKPTRTPRPTPTPQPTWTPTPAPVWSDYNSRAYAVLLDLDALRKEMLGAFGTGDVNLVCAYSRD